MGDHTASARPQGRGLALLKQLAKQRRFDADEEAAPLPRLHIDRSLSNPLLLDPSEFGLEDVSVSPPGLSKNERVFVKDLRAFWTAHQHEEPYRHLEIYLLRNLPKVGVGFFNHSGFYPDFILWARDPRDKTTHVRFIDPHGLHHGGLSGNTNRFEAFRQLKAVSEQLDFQRGRIKLGGFLLVPTPLVPCTIYSFGSRRLSLIRASAVENCQSTVVILLLRFVSHAAISVRNMPISGIRRSKHWIFRALSSISAMLSQLPCLGGWWISSRRAKRCASSGAKAS